MSSIFFNILVVRIIHPTLVLIECNLGFFNCHLDHTDDEVSLCRYYSAVSMLLSVELNVKYAVRLVKDFVYSLSLIHI